MADCSDHVKGNIVNGVRGDVSGGVSGVEEMNGMFEEEKKNCLEIVVRDVREVEPW